MTEEHWIYNKREFSRFVVNHGNWDIYANNKDHCAAIPTDHAAAIGCKASHFGDIEYVRCTLGGILPDYWHGPLIRRNVEHV